MVLIDNLFEVSWEVANKVGGIYTVIATKAWFMKQLAKNYVFIGPYIKGKSDLEIKKLDIPKHLEPGVKDFEVTTNAKIVYGKWLGIPVLLIDFYEFMNREKNNIKARLWEWHKVDSLFSQYEFEEPLTWAWTVGILLKKLFEHKCFNGKTVAHFHEWMSGAGLLYIKKFLPKIKTVFTMHATMLGRALAGNGRHLFQELDKIDPDKEARDYKLQDKHGVERACSLNTDILTTVSNVTALEIERFFKRKPDIILPNGIAIERFPTLEEVTLKHVAAREKIREFLTYYFFPYYTFELEHNLLMFISGRYEMFNKGIDLTIKSLGILNNYLKTQKTKRTITVFFFIPMNTLGIKFEVLENKNYYNIIKHYVQDYSKTIYKNVVNALVGQKKLLPETVFGNEFLQDVGRDVYTFKRTGNPPLSTHNTVDESTNWLVKSLIREGLDNKQDDKVKVVLYPVYLTGTDGLLDLKYYEAIAGFHLGVFPSYYEPWGYTPLESLAMGVPSVTTDTSGFGRYALRLLKTKKKLSKNGLFIVERFEKSFDESAKDLFNIFKKFFMLDHTERVDRRVAAKVFSNQFQWKYLIKHYRKAYTLALSK